VIRIFAQTLKWVFLIALVAFCLVPMLWAIAATFHTNASLVKVPFAWISPAFTLDNYGRVLGNVSLWSAVGNSTVVAVAIATVGVLLSQMAGYVLAKFRFLGRDAIFWTIVATMLIPFPAIMVPVFIMARTLGWVDSLTGLIVPALITATTIFFMRQYLVGLPEDYIEAARIDGASELRIFTSIVLPLTGPVLGSMAVLNFVASWNNFLWPLLITQTENSRTLPVAMTQFQNLYFTDTVALITISVLSSIPVLLVFLLMRRRILSAVMVSGGIK
jgi:ABC-type glycerol-3-phosphate transport system permease component